MESFPLFSPRTLESHCTGTEMSHGVPLGVLLPGTFGWDSHRKDLGLLLSTPVS